MKKRILFVDDETMVLEGLGRMLRGMRDQWDMRFAVGGPEALDVMAAETFDLVVSDMRMPGMDGLRFLTEVRAKYPNAIRVVLSGYSDQLLTMRAAGVAHQYLSKPCDAEMLRSTLTRAFGLQTLMADETIKRLVGLMDPLPSLPALYTEIVQELQSSDASIRHVGEIISKDPGMTAKILQLVNSAFFGIRRRVSHPADAATFLGLETIQSLVFSVKAFSMFNTPVRESSITQIWRHSLATAVLAKRIAVGERAGKSEVDESFTAGLLHDLGKLVLSNNLTRRYGEVIQHAAESGTALCTVEREMLGTTHAEVGAYLLGLWGLPDPIIEAIALHHRPGDCIKKVFTPLSVVHAANALECELQASRRHSVPAQCLDLSYIAAIGKKDRLGEWRAWCLEAASAGEAD